MPLQRLSIQILDVLGLNSAVQAHRSLPIILINHLLRHTKLLLFVRSHLVPSISHTSNHPDTLTLVIISAIIVLFFIIPEVNLLLQTLISNLMIGVRKLIFNAEVVELVILLECNATKFP